MTINTNMKNKFQIKINHRINAKYKYKLQNKLNKVMNMKWSFKNYKKNKTLFMKKNKRFP